MPMPEFSFNKTTRIIEVKAPDPAIGDHIMIQQLINAIRNWEDELVNMETTKIADASGKEDLGGGLQVGITLKLFNWKLKFEARPGPAWIDCEVSGGNLVAVDANNQPVNPIEPSPYVSVTIVKAVSAALIAEWLQSQIDEVVGKVQGLPPDPAAESQVENYVDAALGVIKGAGWTEETLKRIKELVEQSSQARPHIKV